MANPKPKRRWYQFSLRTLLIVMTVATVAFGGWVQFMRYRAKEHRARLAAVTDAVAAIEELGGEVWSEYKERRSQTWLERQFDDPGEADDPVAVLRVGGVSFDHDTATTDIGLEHLTWLTELQVLNLWSTNVTDAGLEHVRKLTKLEHLYLGGTNVTDAGLVHLKGLNKLEHLDLNRTRVTDAGLEHLKTLTKLQELYLMDTNVTDEEVKRLEQALPNCDIFHGPLPELPPVDLGQSNSAPQRTSPRGRGGTKIPHPGATNGRGFTNPKS